MKQEESFTRILDIKKAPMRSFIRLERCEVLTAVVSFTRDPARIRTWDLLLRRQLLYPAELRDHGIKKNQPKYPEILELIVGVAGFEPAASCSQSRRDNRATLHPEAERQGFEPWRRLHADRLAICSVTTPAPLLYFCMNVSCCKRMQM